MCMSSGGGTYEQKAPVAGGYGEVTYEDGEGATKYKLYDDKSKDITKDYTIDKKKQVVKKGADQSGVSADSYLYTRDA